MKRILLAGTPIDAINARNAAEWVHKRFKQGEKTRVTPVNAAVIVFASKHTKYQERLSRFDLLLADGFWPAVAASWLHCMRVPHTNTLPFLRNLLARARLDQLRVFLLGATSEVVKKAAQNLERIHPEIDVVGFHNGYFRYEYEAKIVEAINNSSADMLLLGMSSPKKEVFIYRNWARLSPKISVGVGGLFDIWAGEVNEAAGWMRACGLEWIFRLSQEPRRLFKRYSATNVQFMLLVARQAIQIVFN